MSIQVYKCWFGWNSRLCPRFSNLQQATGSPLLIFAAPATWQEPVEIVQKGKVKGSSSENSGITRAKPGLFSSVSHKHCWWLSNKCQYSNIFQPNWMENAGKRAIKWRLWRLTQTYWSPSSEGNSSMTHNLACPISRLADGRLWRKRLLLRQRNQLSKKCGRQSATIAANNLEWHQYNLMNLIHANSEIEVEALCITMGPSFSYWSNSPVLSSSRRSLSFCTSKPHIG